MRLSWQMELLLCSITLNKRPTRRSITNNAIITAVALHWDKFWSARAYNACKPAIDLFSFAPFPTGRFQHFGVHRSFDNPTVVCVILAEAYRSPGFIQNSKHCFSRLVITIWCANYFLCLSAMCLYV